MQAVSALSVRLARKASPERWQSRGRKAIRVPSVLSGHKDPRERVQGSGS